MLLQSYHFRLKTASETFTEQNHLSNSDSLLIYFKGDKGFTQSLLIPLGTLNEEIYEKQVELLDVGNVNKMSRFLIIILYDFLIRLAFTCTCKTKC